MDNNNQLIDLIYVNPNSLSKELCIDMINLFENDKHTVHGETGRGLDKEIKDTTDLVISNGGKSWERINELLTKELNNNVIEYVKQFDNYINSIIERDDINNDKYKYKSFSNYLSIPSMQIQRYIKNSGKYIYHNDYRCHWEDRKMRRITFMWYLNDVVEGGETEFLAKYNIKPEVGKLVLFPASWTFPHRAKMPISSNKYIITGWLYEHFE